MKMDKIFNQIKTAAKRLWSDYSRTIIIVALILALVLVIFLALSGRDKDKSTSKGCEQHKDEVMKVIDKMNYCETVNDCVLINGCPHGCNKLINKNAEWAELNELSFSYVDKCGECTEICQGALRAEEIRCENGKCLGR
jgi:hypothetical protein